MWHKLCYNQPSLQQKHKNNNIVLLWPIPNWMEHEPFEPSVSFHGMASSRLAYSLVGGLKDPRQISHLGEISQARTIKQRLEITKQCLCKSKNHSLPVDRIRGGGCEPSCKTLAQVVRAPPQFHQRTVTSVVQLTQFCNLRRNAVFFRHSLGSGQKLGRQDCPG